MGQHKNKKNECNCENCEWQLANVKLLDAMEVLIKMVKDDQDQIEELQETVHLAVMEELAMTNVLKLHYAYVIDRFGLDPEELEAEYDSWYNQFSEEELNAIRDEEEDPPIRDEKIVAEVPQKLYTLDEIMSELNPPEEDTND